MTALDLASTPSKGISWKAVRLTFGALLLLAGVSVLIHCLSSHETAALALGIILGALGGAAMFESTAESTLIPAAAVTLSLIPFGLFIAVVAGKDPFHAFYLLYAGSFAKWFTFQETLTYAAPLMLTGLCTALPMRVGLVIIGGEGALVMGALMSGGVGHFAQIHGASNGMIVFWMLLAASATGAFWIALAGALKHYRGVNETISSLLLIYIGVALMNHIVEGPWRDPASLNKPSTWSVLTPDGDYLLGGIHFGSFTMDVHWGLIIGFVVCLLCWILMNHTTFGFAAQVVGGNMRAAKVVGLSVGKVILITCALAGAAAGLAGGIEVAAVQGTVNATIVAGYGYTGILVAFLARQNPLAIIPVAILLGGINASNNLLQSEMGLPDATVRVLQGLIFLVILASESYYGKLKFFKKSEAVRA